MKRWLVFLSILFGSLFFGLIFILIFIHSTELDCLKQSDGSYTCQIRTLFFDKVQMSKRSVEHIVDIVVVDDGCSDGCSYRAEFVTADGDQQPLSIVYTDHGPVTKQAFEIGSQISQGVDHIIYKINPPWWVLFLVGGLTVMSMLLSPLALRIK